MTPYVSDSTSKTKAAGFSYISVNIYQTRRLEQKLVLIHKYILQERNNVCFVVINNWSEFTVILSKGVLNTENV